MQAGIIAIAVVIVALSMPIFERIQDAIHPKQPLYGTWVEQDVAGYSVDSFTLSDKGVKIAGRYVGTRFSFDGTLVEFHVGEERKTFKVLDANMSEMKLISESHYQPVYRLSEKFKNNIR